MTPTAGSMSLPGGQFLEWELSPCGEGNFEFTIAVTGDGESINKASFWAFSFDAQKDLVTGRGGLAALIAAKKILAGLVHNAPGRIFIFPTDEERASAYRRIEKIGFVPFTSIQFDGGICCYAAPAWIFDPSP